MDRLSKERHHIATDKELYAERLADLLMKHVSKHHGLPRSIVFDRGSQFISDFWGFLCITRAAQSLDISDHEHYIAAKNNPGGKKTSRRNEEMGNLLPHSAQSLDISDDESGFAGKQGRGNRTYPADGWLFASTSTAGRIC